MRRDHSSNLFRNLWKNWVRISFWSFVSWYGTHQTQTFRDLRWSWRIEYIAVELISKEYSIYWYVTYENHLQSIIEQHRSFLSSVTAVRGRFDRWTSKTSNFAPSYSWNQLRTVRAKDASSYQAATKRARLSPSFKRFSTHTKSWYKIVVQTVETPLWKWPIAVEKKSKYLVMHQM